ncbi:ABC transporter permease [Arthrobacter sp. GMC3]|uniref:ABC transporter permease n=1 Tax=Arthrobacter sp. GMC3 TaxID=2058894 RepID=UPI000CE452D2|nr:ABC transporter permease [Arthrobacter sp. GMC3]
MTSISTGSARPSPALAMRSLLRADFLVLLNSKTSGLLSFFPPVVIVVATTFGKSQSRLGGPGLIIGLALTIGLIISCLLGYTLALAHDREIGVLQRLRVTPAPTWMILSSRLIVQVVINLVASIVVVIVGAILHGLAITAGQYLLVLAIATLGAAVFLSIGQALVGLVRSTNAINAIARLLMAVLMILGLVGGTGLLGDTLKTIADWTPVGALMTLFSDVLNHAAWSSQTSYALLACTGYIIVFAYIGIRWFRWESR